MAEQRDGVTLRRRGLMAGAAAMVAGIAMKQTSQPVKASVTKDDFIQAAAPSAVTSTSPGFQTISPGGTSNVYTVGADIYGTITGVIGGTASGDGVKGTTVTGHGVHGVAGDNGTGVRGEGTTASGVIGVATTGYGVQGINNSANTPAIYGTNSNISGVAIHGENVTNTGYGVMGGRVNVSGNPFNGAGVYGKADGGHALHGEAGSGWGLYATSTGPNPTAFAQNTGSGYGVHGKASGSNAVYGECSSASASGVVGTNSNNGTGVYGYSGNGAGVYGSSNGSGYGVRGQISGAAANTVAMLGENLSTGAGGTGVVGTSAKGSGVVGGTQTAGSGIAGGYFYTTANSGSGVVGQCFNPGGGAAAFVGAAVAPNYAAYFTGDVVVTGNFIVGKINGVGTGGGKSAAVEDKVGGGHRLVYCVESPESWFEDFGEGQIEAGKAEVKVDPAFMALIHADSYHVFLTEHGGHNGLHTTRKGANGFTVEASPLLAKAAGTSVGQVQGTFSWRVVGKRGDTTLERFAPYAMPAIKVADKPPAFPAVATPVDEPLPKPGPAPQPQPRAAAATATAPVAPAAPAAPVAPTGQGGQGAPTTSVPAPVPPSR